MKMSAARVIGGLIALFGGFIVLLACLMTTGAFALGGIFLTQWLINFLIAILGTIGGILGIANKGSGGGLALIAGLFAIICEVLFWINPATFTVFSQYMLLETWLSFVIPYVTLEGIFMTLGGIIILAGSSK
jgi:hypothetical protein